MLENPVRRRTVLKRVTAFGAAIAAVFGLGYAGSQPSAAIETDGGFVADDVRLERNDGELRSVTVQPELDLEWRNFGDGVDRVDVTMSAALEDTAGFDVLVDGSTEDEAISVDADEFDSTAGTATVALDRIDLTASGSNVSLDDFGGDLAPGESKTTAIDLTLRVDVTGRQAETVTTVKTERFGVTVHNPEGEATTTGRANTDAE